MPVPNFAMFQSFCTLLDEMPSSMRLWFCANIYNWELCRSLEGVFTSQSISEAVPFLNKLLQDGLVQHHSFLFTRVTGYPFILYCNNFINEKSPVVRLHLTNPIVVKNTVVGVHGNFVLAFDRMKKHLVWAQKIEDSVCELRVNERDSVIGVIYPSMRFPTVVYSLFFGKEVFKIQKPKHFEARTVYMSADFQTLYQRSENNIECVDAISHARIGKFATKSGKISAHFFGIAIQCKQRLYLYFYSGALKFLQKLTIFTITKDVLLCIKDAKLKWYVLTKTTIELQNEWFLQPYTYATILHVSEFGAVVRFDAKTFVFVDFLTREMTTHSFDISSSASIFVNEHSIWSWDKWNKQILKMDFHGTTTHVQNITDLTEIVFADNDEIFII